MEPAIAVKLEILLIWLPYIWG